MLSKYGLFDKRYNLVYRSLENLNLGGFFQFRAWKLFFQVHKQMNQFMHSLQMYNFARLILRPEKNYIFLGSNTTFLQQFIVRSH